MVHLEDVIDNESQRLSESEDAKLWLCIPPIWEFIWETLQDIPLLQVQGYFLIKGNVVPWVGWQLKDGT